MVRLRIGITANHDKEEKILQTGASPDTSGNLNFGYNSATGVISPASILLNRRQCHLVLHHKSGRVFGN